MDGPTKDGRDWVAKKYRVKVSICNQHREQKTWAYIECSHTPLRDISLIHQRSLGKFLHADAIDIKI